MEKPASMLNLYVSKNGEAVFSMWNWETGGEYPDELMNTGLCKYLEQDVGHTIWVHSYVDGTIDSSMPSHLHGDYDDDLLVMWMAEQTLKYAYSLGWEPGPDGPRVLLETLYTGEFQSASKFMSEEAYNSAKKPKSRI